MILSYLLGSVLFGPIIASARGIDLRKVGSGNVGATNMFRALGWKYGSLVLVLDAAKGAMPVLIALYFGLRGWEVVAVGMAAVIGHLLPIFSNFSGGKGVAVAVGVFLALNTISMLLALGIFVVVVGATKYVSFGSILGAETIFLLQVLKDTPWADDNLPITALSLALLLIVIYSHKDNISRLWRGQENKIVFRRP